MVFQENQSRQLYVVGSVVTGSTEVTNASTAGAIKVKASADGKDFFFAYKGPSADGLQRSDLIDKCNIMDIRATDAADMVHKMKKVEVTLDSSVSATPIVGQDYILNVDILGYIVPGKNSVNVKFGAAHAFTNVASDLYKALAVSLAKNFAGEAVPLVSIALKTSGAAVPVTTKTKVADLSSTTATGIIIEEVEQPWRLGAAAQEFVDFVAAPSTIYTAGTDVVWGTVTDVTASNTNKLPNSKKVADMEYAFHKNRGDVYGFQCFPYNIDTTYQVDPANADGYSMLDIHYYYKGNSMNVGNSEKTITLVGTKANLKSLIGAAASGDDPATGLMAILEGTNVTIKESASW